MPISSQSLFFTYLQWRVTAAIILALCVGKGVHLEWEWSFNLFALISAQLHAVGNSFLPYKTFSLSCRTSNAVDVENRAEHALKHFLAPWYLYQMVINICFICLKHLFKSTTVTILIFSSTATCSQLKRCNIGTIKLKSACFNRSFAANLNLIVT